MVSIGCLVYNPGPFAGAVIQGGIFGSQFFLMYVNDALNTIPIGISFLFAHDIKTVNSLKPNKDTTAIRETCKDLIPVSVPRDDELSYRQQQNTHIGVHNLTIKFCGADLQSHVGLHFMTSVSTTMPLQTSQSI